MCTSYTAIIKVYINKYGVLHLFFVEQENPKETTEEREDDKEDITQDTQRWLQISSISSIQNPSMISFPNLTLTHSLITDITEIFHLSSCLVAKQL
jgi:hypothetical protein